MGCFKMKQKCEPKKIASAAYFLVTLYWGFTAVLMRDALVYMDSPSYVFLRFGFAGIVMLPFLWKLRRKIKKPAVIKGCVVGCVIGISMQFTVYSLEFTKVSNSVFFANLSVIIVPLIQAVLHKRSPGKYWFISAAPIVLGLYFLGGGTSFQLNFGDALCVVSSLLLSVQILVISRFVTDDDPMVISIFQVLTASAIGFAGWGFSGFSGFTLNAHSLMILFLTGVLGTAAAYTCQIHAQKYAGPTDISMIGSLYPLFGAVGAVLFPDINGIREPITISLVLGTVLVVAGLLFYAWKGEAKKQ